jgi:Transposase DDE domain
MKKAHLNSGQLITADQLLSLLGDTLLQDLSRQVQADKWVIKLETVVVFKLILCSILDSERLSLRVMAEQFSSVPFQLLEQSVVGQKTAHSSIRDRLVNIKVLFFERLYERTRSLLAAEYSQNELSGSYNLKRYDSTMISVFSHMLQGMKVGNSSKKKNQVKLTTELLGDFEVRMRFFKDQDHLGEEVALREMIQSQTHDSRSLIVFDRGLKSRQTFCELKEIKTQFVTRLNERNRYKFICQHAEVPSESKAGLRFVQDSIVYLYGDGSTLVKEEFRLIEAVVDKNGKKLYFLTNILFLDAQTVAEIYHRRWDIEVFFRFVKQEMNLTHFVCNDLNAIQVMLYCTLIAAMLILVYKKQNGITAYKIAKTKFFKELQAAVTLELIETEKGLEQLKKVLRIYLKRGP